MTIPYVSIHGNRHLLKCTCSEIIIASAAGVVAAVQKDQFNLDFVRQSVLRNHNANVVVSDLIFYSIKKYSFYVCSQV